MATVAKRAVAATATTTPLAADAEAWDGDVVITAPAGAAGSAAVAAVVEALRAADGASRLRVVDGGASAVVSLSFVALRAEAERVQLLVPTAGGVLMPAGAADNVALTSADRIRLTASTLDRLQYMRMGRSVTWMDMQHEGRVSMVPLHHPAELRSLRRRWGTKLASTFAQPVDRIAGYFGEHIAFYFSWLQFYSQALIVPAVAGVLLWAMQTHAAAMTTLPSVIFTLALAGWGTVVMTAWARRQSELAYSWGVFGTEEGEAARPGYVKEPPWLRLVRRLVITLPVMAVCCVASAAALIAIERMRHALAWELNGPPTLAAQSGPGTAPGVLAHTSTSQLEGNVTAGALPPDTVFWRRLLLGVLAPLVPTAPHEPDESAPLRDHLAAAGFLLLTLVRQLPTLAFAVAVPVLDRVNDAIVRRVTDWENHRTSSQWRDAFIAKLCLLRFIDNYTSLAYIAFVQHDFGGLRSKLAFLLVLRAAINNAQEVGTPLLQTLISLLRSQGVLPATAAIWSRQPPSQAPHGDRRGSSDSDEPPRDSGGAPSTVTSVRLQLAQPTYDVDADVLEMWVQFGHVTMFAAAWPLAPAAALLNNLVEVHSDAFKLLAMRRPHPDRVASLGAWVTAFSALSYVAVASNVALLTIAAAQRDAWQLGSTLSYVSVAIVLEHLLIGLKLVMAGALPDVPDGIRAAVRAEERTRMRLLMEGAQAAKADATALPPAPVTAVGAATVPGGGDGGEVPPSGAATETAAADGNAASTAK